MSSVSELAKIIWDYHHLHQSLKKSDLIFVLGSHDIRVAEYASELFLKGYAPLYYLAATRALVEKLADLKESLKPRDFHK